MRPPCSPGQGCTEMAKNGDGEVMPYDDQSTQTKTRFTRYTNRGIPYFNRAEKTSPAVSAGYFQNGEVKLQRLISVYDTGANTSLLP